MTRRVRGGAGGVLAVTACVVALLAPPAEAAREDGFVVRTTDRKHCGEARFVDYGEGEPGWGMNDDYILITDRCRDGHGILAMAWQERQNPPVGKTLLGRKYNGNGAYGPAVVWDPFWGGDVRGGDIITLKVCLVDGADDPTPSSCSKPVRRMSRDG